MSQLPIARLHLLRATYLLILLGMGLQIWPLILGHASDLEHYRGTTWSLLGALTLLCGLGIRYPLRMLPLLLFELAWKAIWILGFGLPAWSAGPLAPVMRETMTACLFGVVLIALVLPWGYVWASYVKAPGDRWKQRVEPASGENDQSGGRVCDRCEWDEFWTWSAAAHDSPRS